MNKFNWIKMGLKSSIIIGLVLILQANVSNKYSIKTENFNFNVTLGMSALAEKQEEEKPKEVVIKENRDNSETITSLTGSLTGYAADCPLCNGTLACKSSYDVYKNGVVTYPDKYFGDVRIVASSKALPCGSVIRFNLKSISSEPIYAIVLDRGVLENNIDLLMPTEKAASKEVGRRTITYEVLRNGW